MTNKRESIEKFVMDNIGLNITSRYCIGRVIGYAKLISFNSGKEYYSYYVLLEDPYGEIIDTSQVNCWPFILTTDRLKTEYYYICNCRRGYYVRLADIKVGNYYGIK